MVQRARLPQRSRICCLPGTIPSLSCSWFWTEATPTKQPDGLTALQPRVKMSGSTEHPPRTRMSSSPSFLRAFFPLNKILIFCTSRTDSTAAQKQQSEEEIGGFGKQSFLWFHLGRENTHCSLHGGCFARQWAWLHLSLDYPAHPWHQTGRNTLRAHPGHLWATTSAQGNLCLIICPASTNTGKGWKKWNTLISITFTVGWFSYSLPRHTRLWAGLVFR